MSCLEEARGTSWAHRRLFVHLTDVEHMPLVAGVARGTWVRALTPSQGARVSWGESATHKPSRLPLRSRVGSMARPGRPRCSLRLVRIRPAGSPGTPWCGCRDGQAQRAVRSSGQWAWAQAHNGLWSRAVAAPPLRGRWVWAHSCVAQPRLLCSQDAAWLPGAAHPSFQGEGGGRGGDSQVSLPLWLSVCVCLLPGVGRAQLFTDAIRGARPCKGRRHRRDAAGCLVSLEPNVVSGVVFDLDASGSVFPVFLAPPQGQAGGRDKQRGRGTSCVEPFCAPCVSSGVSAALSLAAGLCLVSGLCASGPHHPSPACTQCTRASVLRSRAAWVALGDAGLVFDLPTSPARLKQDGALGRGSAVA